MTDEQFERMMTALDSIDDKLDQIIEVKIYLEELKPLVDKYKQFSANPVMAVLRGTKR